VDKRCFSLRPPKHSQDQLFTRDIPELLEILKIPVRVALLKGRSSYVCLHRLANARRSGILQSAAPLRLLGQVESWVTATRTGDVSEVPALEESQQLLPLVASTRENCTTSKCPRYQECHLYKARRDAMAADVVVINHHLFFADSNVRESGVAELLPTVNAVVFDEAHQLNDIGVQFLGRQWSTLQLLNLGRDVVFVCLQWARGMANWQLLVEQLEMAVVDMQLVCQESAANTPRLPWQALVFRKDCRLVCGSVAWDACCRPMPLYCKRFMAWLMRTRSWPPWLNGRRYLKITWIGQHFRRMMD